MAVTVAETGQFAVPLAVRRRAGIKPGDRLEFEASRGVITIRKREEDDEYTPAQRRAIEARLKIAEEDVRAGRVYGPFSTHQEMMASLLEVGKRPGVRQASKRSKRK